MALPEFDSHGDLPEGVHQASLDEVLARFGQGARERQLVTESLKRIYQLACETGKLERFVIFGSYVTAKPEPNDVDIILVMRDDFTERDYDATVFPMFDHLRVQQQLGASLFVIRPAFIFGESVDEFIAHWQIKRDLSRHGIVEVTPEALT
jgi:predicted nucleotidyltransferase